MVLKAPEKGKCNFPLTFRCQCGKKVKKGKCKCGGKLIPISFCGNSAGKGTDHKGEGYCYHHDGAHQSVSPIGRLKQALPNLVHGHYSHYLRNVLLSAYEEEITDLLQMVKEDPDTVLQILTAKAALLYSKTGDPRQAKIVIETLKESVKTEKERREKGLVKKEEPVDLAELITDLYIQKREKERGQKREKQK